MLEEFKGDRARTDDSSEDVQKDWKSVPSCGTRHSSVDSNSSMFSLFDYQVEFMAIADRSMPKDTPATTTEPSSHHLDAFSNSATFSEIRCFLEAPENELFCVANDAVGPDRRYQACDMFLIDEGSRISILPSSVHRRTEIYGVFVMDIAEVISVRPLQVGSNYKHSKRSKSVDFSIEVSSTGYEKELIQSASPVVLYGLTIIATERRMTLYTQEMWRRNRIIERLNQLRTITMDSPGTVHFQRWLRNTLNLRYGDNCNDELLPHVSTEPNSTAADRDERIRRCVSKVQPDSLPVSFMHYSVPEGILFYEVMHHECPHRLQHKYLVINKNEETIRLENIVNEEVGDENDSDDNLPFKKVSALLPKSSAENCYGSIAAEQECRIVCTKAKQYKADLIAFRNVCEIREGSYGCFFSEEAASAVNDSCCLSIVGIEGSMCLQCVDRSSNKALVNSLLVDLFPTLPH